MEPDPTSEKMLLSNLFRCINLYKFHLPKRDIHQKPFSPNKILCASFLLSCREFRILMLLMKILFGHPTGKVFVFVATIVLVTLFMVSCEDIAPPTEPTVNSFETDFYEMDCWMQPEDLKGFQIFAEEFFSLDLSTLDVTVAEGIQEVILQEAEISLEPGVAYTNFNMLRFIELTVYTDSLGETKIAWSNPVPADSASISLELSEENVLPYCMEQNFMLTIQGYLNERITEEIKLHARVKFLVRSRF